MEQIAFLVVALKVWLIAVSGSMGVFAGIKLAARLWGPLNFTSNTNTTVRHVNGKPEDTQP